MENQFVVYLGCCEWQTTETFISYEDANKYVSELSKTNFSLGSYPADFGWIENTITGEKEHFIQ